MIPIIPKLTFEFCTDVGQLLVDALQFCLFAFAVSNIRNEDSQAAHSIALKHKGMNRISKGQTLTAGMFPVRTLTWFKFELFEMFFKHRNPGVFKNNLIGESSNNLADRI